MATIIDNGVDRNVVDDETYVSYYSPVGRVVWFLLWVINGLLAIRFVLRLLAANPSAGFTNFIYSITSPLVSPFRGVLASTTAGSAVLEWSTLLAMVIYWLLAWAIVRLFTVAKPLAR